MIITLASQCKRQARPTEKLRHQAESDQNRSAIPAPSSPPVLSPLPGRYFSLVASHTILASDGVKVIP
jgi:hypothetical protein